MTGAEKDPYLGKRAADSTGHGDTPFGEYSGLGLQFAVSMLVWAWVGQWLDKKYGTGPWILIGMLFVAGGLSFYNMYRKLMRIQARDDAARAARKSAQ